MVLSEGSDEEEEMNARRVERSKEQTVVCEEAEEEGVPTSGHTGVVWDKHAGKWIGRYSVKLQRTTSGKRKNAHTSYFPKDQLTECIEAFEALKKEGDDRYCAQVIEWKDADPKFEGVPLGPEDAADADVDKVYWRPNKHDGHRPFFAVRMSAGKQGFKWVAACQERGCTNKAVPPKDGAAVRCIGHGGGCPHHRQWVKCRECNPKATEQMNNCSSCAQQIYIKRCRSKGGPGLCTPCEDQKNDTETAERAAEAAARGEAAPAPPSKKPRPNTKEQEIKMYERLIAAGYHWSREGGRTPRPGEFTREVYFDHRCALARNFEADEKKYGYVDFVVCPKKGGVLVFLEVDEHEHKCANYTVLCDTTRMSNICESVKLDGSGEKNVLWLRLNPDTRFTIGNDTHAPSNTARCDAACRLIDSLEGTPDDPPMRIAYACYQMEADHTPKLTRDPDYHRNVLPAVVRLKHRVGADGELTLKK
jgi:hypothetical protein